MARRLKILDSYSDLCSMLDRWVIHQLKSVAGGLGYPRKSLDFAYVTSPASSVDPTGYSAEDHAELEIALDSLAKEDGELFAAIKMHYMPWTIIALQGNGYPFAPHQTYYDRLKRAHAWLHSEMQGIMSLRKARNAEQYRQFG